MEEKGEFMEIISLLPRGFESNSYILHSGSEAFAVDPSVDSEKVLCALGENGLTLRGIILTHGHFDHIYHLKELKSAVDVPVYVHTLDAKILTDNVKNAYSVFLRREFSAIEADRHLEDGSELSIGDEKLRVIHSPGHTKGSICIDAGDFLLTGDTLFAQGIGRCDLYGGDADEMRSSLRRLSALPDKPIYCGHGEPSTLQGALKRINFYF